MQIQVKTAVDRVKAKRSRNEAKPCQIKGVPELLLCRKSPCSGTPLHHGEVTLI